MNESCSLPPQLPMTETLPPIRWAVDAAGDPAAPADALVPGAAAPGLVLGAAAPPPQAARTRMHAAMAPKEGHRLWKSMNCLRKERFSGGERKNRSLDVLTAVFARSVGRTDARARG